MVAVNMNIVVKQSSITKVIDKIKEFVNRTIAREIEPSSTPIIREAINDAFEAHRGLFIPSSSDAGELGIGEGGSIDEDKRSNAWRALLIENGERGEVTSFKMTRITKNKNGVIFDIEMTINEAAFFNADRSIIPTPDSRKLTEIPWMDWFINGNTIQEYGFSEAPGHPRSRTGRGLMIRGGLWTFTPTNRDTFGTALEEACLLIAKRFKERLGARLLRRFK